MCRIWILWGHSHSCFPLDPANFKSLCTNIMSGWGCSLGIGLYRFVYGSCPEPYPEQSRRWIWISSGWRQELISLFGKGSDPQLLTQKGMSLPPCVFFFFFFYWGDCWILYKIHFFQCTHGGPSPAWERVLGASLPLSILVLLNWYHHDTL